MKTLLSIIIVFGVAVVFPLLLIPLLILITVSVIEAS
jgi:hypothetical protein